MCCYCNRKATEKILNGPARFQAFKVILLCLNKEGLVLSKAMMGIPFTYLPGKNIDPQFKGPLSFKGKTYNERKKYYNAHKPAGFHADLMISDTDTNLDLIGQQNFYLTREYGSSIGVTVKIQIRKDHVICAGGNQVVVTQFTIPPQEWKKIEEGVRCLRTNERHYKFTPPRKIWGNPEIEKACAKKGK